MKLFQIMVPTLYGDTEKPIRKKHHQSWDKVVRSITGGLTICSVAKGQWVDKKENKLWQERVIPVQIACTPKQMGKIVEFSLSHYRQKAIMYAMLSDQVFIVDNAPRIN